MQSNDKDVGTHSEIPYKADNPFNLIVESSVQYGNSGQYGVIKWIGILPGSEVPYAGLEMVKLL